MHSKRSTGHKFATEVPRKLGIRQALEVVVHRPLVHLLEPAVAVWLMLWRLLSRSARRRSAGVVSFPVSVRLRQPG